MHRAIACFALAWGLPFIAAADTGAGTPATTGGTTVTVGEVDTAAELLPAERDFVFTDDPSLPMPGHVVLSAGMGNVTRTGEERPVGAGEIIPTVGVEVGILPRLSFYADAGAIFWSPGMKDVSPITFEAGPRVLLTNPGSHEILVTIQPSYGYDFYGNSTLLFNAAFAWNYRILRVVASATVSHTFQPGADPADVAATVGASVRLPLDFRVGLEGVVTDLEEIATPGAEGGSSAFVGPTLGWGWKHLFQIVAGPAYGFGPNYTGFLGRVAVSAQL